MKISLPEIKRGMKVKCLNCNKTIELNDKSLTMDCIAEYIKCPNCEKVYDVQAYNLYGSLADKE